jgi:peroxiredoxin
MLAKQQKLLHEEGLELLFVSVDEPETQAQAVAFAQEHGVPGPILVAERPLGEFKAALNPRWPGMLPATFLYDNTGRLRYFWGGPVFEEELRKIVDGFLRGEKIDGEQVEGLSPGLDAREDPL